MQRSSETIGAIAAALARAQGELANPEKSLVATIRACGPREMDQTFRYAALSTGLDIVRKALGGHEIAMVQTTAIDKEAGLIRLTTTLAHASGEWLSSEWPVCSIAETAAPRRMGAALTYARRYTLSTLVGIAGEDDLDAPDLAAGGNFDKNPGLEIQTTTKPVANERPVATSDATRKGKVTRPPRIVLATNQSKALRDRLVAELQRSQISGRGRRLGPQEPAGKKYVDVRRRQAGRGHFPREAGRDWGRTVGRCTFSGGRRA